MTLGASVEASLPATAPTWARLPDRVPLDRPGGADLKPSGDCNDAGVSGQCEDLRAEPGCRARRATHVLILT